MWVYVMICFCLAVSLSVAKTSTVAFFLGQGLLILSKIFQILHDDINLHWALNFLFVTLAWLNSKLTGAPG